MNHVLMRLHALVSWWRHMLPEELLAVLLAVLMFAAPVVATTRFERRSLFMNSALPGVTTSYKVSLDYMTPEPVGSVDLLFCYNPIPYEPCVTPAGLDVSNAVLSQQTGETGFSISTQSTNHIVLTRSPTMIAGPGSASSYTFENIVNPTDISQAFSIRLRSHASTDATGPLIDFGSVRGKVTNAIVLETQVPPMLIFCLAGQVEDNCAGTNDNYYTDMGELSPTSTLTAQSEMAVGTNATAGFVITANGAPMAAGTSVIEGLAIPTESRPGTNQFGINLVQNTTPVVGSDPEGTWLNAVPYADYGIPNRYKFVSGDPVAYSPNVSLMKKFTISYIVNSSEDLRPGVYTTTVTFVASGRF